jgi:hypothetical protein
VCLLIAAMRPQVHGHRTVPIELWSPVQVMAGGRRGTVMGEAGGPEEEEVKAAPHRLSERFCQLSGVAVWPHQRSSPRPAQRHLLAVERNGHRTAGGGGGGGGRCSGGGGWT